MLLGCINAMREAQRQMAAEAATAFAPASVGDLTAVGTFVALIALLLVRRHVVTLWDRLALLGMGAFMGTFGGVLFGFKLEAMPWNMVTVAAATGLVVVFHFRRRAPAKERPVTIVRPVRVDPPARRPDRKREPVGV